MSRYESWASSPAARATMQGNRRRDTAPEMAVRRLLHRTGLRYRVDAKPIPHLNRRADLVFSRARVAVFIDGCFWHGCPRHGTDTRTNSEYWSAKIAGNKTRDIDTNRRLLDAGWTVIRAWEHDDPNVIAARVRATVLRRTRGDSHH